MTSVINNVSYGTPPLTVAEAKSYMKITFSIEDALITAMISAITLYVENYTGKELRANTWNLLLDKLCERIVISKYPVDTVSHINYIVSGSPVTIDPSIYYLKDNIQDFEILLFNDKIWPTDGDDIEQGIEIQFITKPIDEIDLAIDAIKIHLAYLYENRGSCSVKDAAEESGAVALYDMISIPRF